MLLAVWNHGDSLINEGNQRWAQLVRKWVTTTATAFSIKLSSTETRLIRAGTPFPYGTRSTQPSIPLGSVNEYQLQLGNKQIHHAMQ